MVAVFFDYLVMNSVLRFLKCGYVIIADEDHGEKYKIFLKIITII